MSKFILLMCLAALISTAAAQIDVSQAFFPSGTFGDWGDVTLEEARSEDSPSPPECIRISYSAAQSQSQGYAGICWQYPDSNMGDLPGQDLTGSTALTFWARGEIGGEQAEFSVGGATDFLPERSTGVVSLSPDWQQFTIPLEGMDLSSVINGFCWRTTKDHNPYGCTVYLDDILYQ
ncbi:MAG: hypothetical protein GKC10_05875 [Methanosarcinales archaeon]|nr:hypothetical protein [Methanosarcinales archaeon]